MPRSRHRFVRFRHWVQFLFLGVWLGPFGLRLMTVPGCVFHCYNCPLASLACPVGVVAQFSALHVFPLMALGILVLIGGLSGALVCGWACPFGFLQDLLAKLPTPRFRIPDVLGFGRYAVLLVMVLAVPYLWGEGHALFICRSCPAGALEGGVGVVIRDGLTGKGWHGLAPLTYVILGVFFAASLLTYRPWCKVLCPLGGFLSLFNPLSSFQLHFGRSRCTACNLCRSRCAMGVEVEKRVNSSRCIRCTECTTCGAIFPAIGKPALDQHPERHTM